MVREAQLAQYNYILVVGRSEVEHKTVNVRTRDNAVHGEKDVSRIFMFSFTSSFLVVANDENSLSLSLHSVDSHA